MNSLCIRREKELSNTYHYQYLFAHFQFCMCVSYEECKINKVEGCFTNGASFISSDFLSKTQEVKTFFVSRCKTLLYPLLKERRSRPEQLQAWAGLTLTWCCSRSNMDLRRLHSGAHSRSKHNWTTHKKHKHKPHKHNPIGCVPLTSFHSQRSAVQFTPLLNSWPGISLAAPCRMLIGHNDQSSRCNRLHHESRQLHQWIPF